MLIQLLILLNKNLEIAKTDFESLLYHDSSGGVIQLSGGKSITLYTFNIERVSETPSWELINTPDVILWITQQYKWPSVDL